jgi:pimeloyl-ACP methyl ester carboxylesterase
MKLLSSLLAVALFVLVTIVTISGFLLYQVLHPARTPASFDLNVMMGHPVTFSFPVANGGTREGWFFPGLRGAPTVIVCHGYLSQRADVLTLVSALQDQQFNVFVFDFSGHGTTLGMSTLGFQETAELESAISALATRDDVDPKHFALWGVDMGGYAALEAATTDSRVAAFIVDDPYPDPGDMLQILIRPSGLTVVPLVSKFTDLAFRLVNYKYRQYPPVTGQLIRTKGIPKLFFLADDRPALGDDTLQLFTHSPDPKQLVRNRSAYSVMSDEDRKNYENQVVSFFLLNIPPTTRPVK